MPNHHHHHHGVIQLHSAAATGQQHTARYTIAVAAAAGGSRTYSESSSFSPGTVHEYDMELEQIVDDVDDMYREQQLQCSSQTSTAIKNELIKKSAQNGSILSQYLCRSTQDIADEIAKSLVDRALESDRKKVVRERGRLSEERERVEEEAVAANFVEVSVNRTVEAIVGEIIDEQVNDIANLLFYGCGSNLANMAASGFRNGTEVLQATLDGVIGEITETPNKTFGLYRCSEFRTKSTDEYLVNNSDNDELVKELTHCSERWRGSRHVCDNACAFVMQRRHIRQQVAATRELNEAGVMALVDLVKADAEKPPPKKEDERRKRNSLGILMSSLRKKVYHCRCVDCQAERKAEGKPEPEAPIEIKEMEMPEVPDNMQIVIPRSKKRGRPRIFPRLEDLLLHGRPRSQSLEMTTTQRLPEQQRAAPQPVHQYVQAAPATEGSFHQPVPVDISVQPLVTTPLPQQQPPNQTVKRPRGRPRKYRPEEATASVREGHDGKLVITIKKAGASIQRRQKKKRKRKRRKKKVLEGDSWDETSDEDDLDDELFQIQGYNASSEPPARIRPMRQSAGKNLKKFIDMEEEEDDIEDYLPAVRVAPVISTSSSPGGTPEKRRPGRPRKHPLVIPVPGEQKAEEESLTHAVLPDSDENAHQTVLVLVDEQLAAASNEEMITPEKCNAKVVSAECSAPPPPPPLQQQEQQAASSSPTSSPTKSRLGGSGSSIGTCPSSRHEDQFPFAMVDDEPDEDLHARAVVALAAAAAAVALAKAFDMAKAAESKEISGIFDCNGNKSDTEKKKKNSEIPPLPSSPLSLLEECDLVSFPEGRQVAEKSPARSTAEMPASFCSTETALASDLIITMRGSVSIQNENGEELNNADIKTPPTPPREEGREEFTSRCEEEDQLRQNCEKEGKIRSSSSSTSSSSSSSSESLLPVSPLPNCKTGNGEEVGESRLKPAMEAKEATTTIMPTAAPLLDDDDSKETRNPPRLGPRRRLFRLKSEDSPLKLIDRLSGIVHRLNDKLRQSKQLQQQQQQQQEEEEEELLVVERVEEEQVPGKANEKPRVKEKEPLCQQTICVETEGESSEFQDEEGTSDHHCCQTVKAVSAATTSLKSGRKNEGEESSVVASVEAAKATVEEEDYSAVGRRKEGKSKEMKSGGANLQGPVGMRGGRAGGGGGSATSTNGEEQTAKKKKKKKKTKSKNDKDSPRDVEDMFLSDVEALSAIPVRQVVPPSALRMMPPPKPPIVTIKVKKANAPLPPADELDGGFFCLPGWSGIRLGSLSTNQALRDECSSIVSVANFNSKRRKQQKKIQ
jgi:hypothetical protein